MTKPQRLPTEEARKKFADLLNGAQFRSEHTEITRHNKAAGYLVPPRWYEAAATAIAEAKAARQEAERHRQAAEEARAEADELRRELELLRAEQRTARLVPQPAGLERAMPRISARCMALSDIRARTFADQARSLADAEQRKHMVTIERQAADAGADRGDMNRAIVTAAMDFPEPLLADSDLNSAE